MNNLIEQDKIARERALDTTKSFIVEAPAGSGKTEILIQRFLSLLTTVNQPEEILAITFTKKAANEMRHRILTALSNASEDIAIKTEHEKKTRMIAKSVLKRDKHLSWQLLKNPNQLKIQTIDSFCSYLTKQLPILSHLGATTEISTAPNTLYEEAALSVIMHVEENHAWSEDIKTLLLYLDNDLEKLRQLLVNMLTKRDQWLSLIYSHHDFSEIRSVLESNLARLIEETLQKTRPLFNQEITSELVPLLRFAASNLKLDNAYHSPIIIWENMKALPQTIASNKIAWNGISHFLLTKKHEFRKRPDPEIGFPPQHSFKNAAEINLHKLFREKYKELLKKLEDREDIRSLLKDIQLLPQPTYNDKQWKILCALISILKIVNAELRLVFQSHGKIDFIENVQAALATLGSADNPTDLALSLDYQLRHVLIDEFQDTSYTQYVLLEKLVAGWLPDDGRTLFVVGDPMQSIYRFREADVGLFIKMGQCGINNLSLEPLKLTVNFRSNSNIVFYNNAIFSKIFPKHNEISTGAVAYGPSIAKKDDEDLGPGHSYHAIGFVNDEGQREAEGIKDLILEQLNQNPDDTIAILVKSRSHLKHLLPVLQKNNISYQAVDIDSLSSKQSIQDLIALTRALYNPIDKIAWLSILRAPWCGMTLTELYHLVQHSLDKTLMETIKSIESITYFSANTKKNMLRFSRIMQKQLSMKCRVPLREWIEHTWLELGGPACLENKSDIDDTNAFFQTLEALEISNDFSIKNLTKRINELFASTHHPNARLQIMTIHAAKGLEFDTVILPQLHRKSLNDEKSLMLWLERPLLHENQRIFLLAPINEFGQSEDALYHYILSQNKIKSTLELDRLLYVAASRARKRLYLTFNLSEEKDISIPANTFVAKLWPHLHSNHLLNLKTSTCANINQATIAPLRPIKRLSQAWTNPLENNTPILDSLHTKLSGFQFKSTTAQKVGTITHRILQQISSCSLSWWNTKHETQKLNFIKSQLYQLNVPYSEIENEIKKIFTAIEKMLSDERGLWILQNHRESYSEFRMSFIHNQKLENIIIDRTFIDNNDVRWIIDYKTSIATENLEDFLEQAQKTYSEKMSLYSHCFQTFENRPIKLGLYFPLVPAWKEWS